MYNYFLPYQNQNQPAQDERIWVQNQMAAEAYLVAPNGFVRLWDASKPVFYEKRADVTGRPMPLDVYKYEKTSIQANLSDNSTIDYRNELDGLMRRVEALEKGLKNANAESNTDDTNVQSVQG